MKKDILTVSRLTNAIKLILEEGIGSVSVQGEISNFKAHSSGHRYFTLKDEGSQVACTMWKSRPLNFQPEDGMKVVVKGSLSVYPPRGSYQIDCASMEPLGQGDLYLAFEALKKKLEELGYFDSEIKKPLPDMPLHIGVATSPTGAAVRDIMSTIENRFPSATVYFRPTIVQGGDSAPDIVRAVEDLHNTPSEVLIVGRGGGSIEDLWAFNTEEVANAIFNSELPFISAVGHETDFTISDFVADVRAATPTAGAVLATPVTGRELMDDLLVTRQTLSRIINEKIRTYKNLLATVSGPSASRRIIEKINIFRQQVDEYDSQLSRSVRFSIREMKQKVDSLNSHCRSLYPLSPLKKGFAIIKGAGEIIGNTKSLAEFKEIEILRENESAKAKVVKILPKPLF